jgi:capsular polysaccharide biosynthesis protein
VIQEPLDLRRALVLVRRRKLVVGAAAVLGLLAGAGYAAIHPPALSAQTWVLLAPSHEDRDPTDPVRTQVIIAGSDPVLADAGAKLQPHRSVLALRDTVQVEGETANIIGISAEGETASRAEATANAVAQSYVSYVRQPGNLPDGPLQAQVLQPATTASGTSQVPRLIGLSLLGGLIAAVIASFAVLALTHRDRRLRERDEIADAIGVPVLASLNVERPSDTAGWAKLLQSYAPTAVDGWRLRKTLQYLGVTDLGLPDQTRVAPFPLTILSLSFDRRALALGPQLAVFAASRGIPTALVLGPQQDVHATATLRAACATAAQPSNSLRLIVSDDERATRPSDAALVVAVAVAVVDAQAPHMRSPRPSSWDDVVGGATGSGAAVLAVSAGVATAEQLAGVAAGAAALGHEIVGILVADPDPADSTTGRLPQVARPARARRPNRMTATGMEGR